MPSQALNIWRTDRIARLIAVERQCAATAALIPPNLELADENPRGLTMILSAHFQGYRRDLHTECTMILAGRIRNKTIRILFQDQFTTGRALDRGSPNLQNINQDFKRLSFDFNLAKFDTDNNPRIKALDELNKSRNTAAHHDKPPEKGMPDLIEIQNWRIACEGLATSLDRLMSRELQRVLGKPPWKP